MIKTEVPIEVNEGDDPLLTCHIIKTINNVTTDYDFTGTTEVQFIVKPGKAVETALATYSSIGPTPAVAIVSPPTGGSFTVQITGLDVMPIGTKRYKVRVENGGKWETVMAGPFIVKNL